MIRLKEAQRLPPFLMEATPLPAPGLYTLCQLTPIVLHYLRVCVCVRLLPPRLYRAVSPLFFLSPVSLYIF